MNLNLRRTLRRVTAFTTFALAIFAAGSYASAGIVGFSGVSVLGSPPAPGVHPGDLVTTPDPIVFQEVANGVIPAGGLVVDHNGSNVTATPVETAFVVNPLLVS